MTSDFSLETKQARRQCKFLKENKNCQLRILYLAKILFKNKGKNKIFRGMQKLKEFSTSRSIRNVKHSLSAKRKVIPDKNPGLHRGVKNTRNANYMVSLIGTSLKDHWLFVGS